MKLNKKDNKMVGFDTLQDGDVFENKGNLFLKIEAGEDYNDGPFNSVNLENGMLHYYEFELVRLVEGEFVED